MDQDQKSTSVRVKPLYSSQLILDTSGPRKKILVVVTAGGTHAAPIIEIARILASRGHQIDYGSLEEGIKWVEGVEFISKVYILGPPASLDQSEEFLQLLGHWDTENPIKSLVTIKQLIGSSWPNVYASLGKIVTNPKTRPDLIFADFLVDAVHDVSREHDIPVAMHWPQMPTMMLPASYLPGQAGLQCEVLTSEYATLWQRLKNELVLLRGLPYIIRHGLWVRDMRRQAGVQWMLPVGARKPDHLVLVNSYFGLETAKDLPPLVSAIGPVLPDIYPPLCPASEEFLDTHDRVLYHAMGTVVTPPLILIQKLVSGLLIALDSGVIDGVIWVMKRSMLHRMDSSEDFHKPRDQRFNLKDVVSGKHPQILVLDYARQRAILDYSHTALFLTHGGGSSSNELTYHGVAAITLAVMTDQTQNALRLRDAGVSIPLNPATFTANELFDSIKTILEDDNGSFTRNVWRMKQIARVNSRRKYVAADLIEEVIWDHEGRHANGQKVRPMHRQTADMRMPWYKAQNRDLQGLVVVVGLVIAKAVVVLVPMSWSTFKDFFNR